MTTFGPFQHLVGGALCRARGQSRIRRGGIARLKPAAVGLPCGSRRIAVHNASGPGGGTDLGGGVGPLIGWTLELDGAAASSSAVTSDDRRSRTAEAAGSRHSKRACAGGEQAPALSARSAPTGGASSWLGLHSSRRCPRPPALSHQRRRPNLLAIVDNGSGRAVCGSWASSL